MVARKTPWSRRQLWGVTESLWGCECLKVSSHLIDPSGVVWLRPSPPTLPVGAVPCSVLKPMGLSCLPHIFSPVTSGKVTAPLTFLNLRVPRRILRGCCTLSASPQKSTVFLASLPASVLFLCLRQEFWNMLVPQGSGPGTASVSLRHSCPGSPLDPGFMTIHVMMTLNFALWSDLSSPRAYAPFPACPLTGYASVLK